MTLSVNQTKIKDMRKEQFVVGDYVHVYNRGNRKTEIFRTDADRWRFLQCLRFFNDTSSSLNILRDLSRLTPSVNQPESVFQLGWPANWPERNPLVKILCYCLMPNHFHLLLKEIISGGIAKFMHKLGMGYTKFFNLKYQEVGKVFQGTYKAKAVREQIYLEHLCFYIQVMNVLELFPNGFEAATRNPQHAIKFADEFIFSSHRDYTGLRKSLIIDKDVLGEIFDNHERYQKFIYDSVISKDLSSLSGDLKLD